MKEELRVIISGGGTGGHIFPAISIANAIRELHPEAKILFVGAEGRMEMQRVPAAGYDIKGLPICGFNRANLLKNITLPYKMWKSDRMVRKIIRDFKPDVAVGVGGYASFPTLKAAGNMGIPYLIQEQNSFAGKTNMMLGKKAQKICVAYDGMERFFPSDRIMLTGNPVRQALLETTVTREEARKSLGLDPQKKTILLVGGSLGARTINESMMQHLDLVETHDDIQFLWQTGKYYSEQIAAFFKEKKQPKNLKITDFIGDMGSAYKAADLVISRAGAGSISEFCLLGKAVILVPSPNVAEDHQTKNALALVEKNAALYVKDAEAPETLLRLAIDTVGDEAKLASLRKNILEMALPDSAEIIAKEVMKIAGVELSYPQTPNLGDLKAVYFIGAGGIGMSAIARYFIKRGMVVGGYDKTPSELTHHLEQEGMLLHYDEDVEKIPEACKNRENCLVIYTPAVPHDHKELVWFQENGFEIQKRAQVLGTLTHAHKGLCVAGTHGKTTTSSMCAHILHQSHVECNAFLGGIVKNYGTNYLLSDKSDFVVIEADEFDRSFHWLRPWMSVVTSADPDHLDIYGTEEAYLDAFRHYTSLIQPGGALIIRKGIALQPDVQNGVKTYDYGRDEGDFHAENIRIGNGEIIFDFVSPVENVPNVKLGHPIPINIENGVAAMAMAQLNGCTADELRDGMGSFQGVDRRFDFRLNTAQHVLISDYAHHPKEILESARSIRQIYQNRKITAIFQPHLYTRTRDFYREFADALSLLDEVILCDIYPAREEPILGVTSQLILDHLREGIEKQLVSLDGVLPLVESRDFDVLVILGAGDLDNLVPKIADSIEKREQNKA